MNNYAFIDSQNVYLAVKSQGWKIDWSRFRVYLKEHYGVKNAYLFIGYIEGNNYLYTQLQEAGFICIFKPIMEYKNGMIKGNVDAELVLHAMIEFPNFHQAILVTGDGDFYCLARHFLEKSKLLTVLIPDGNRYSALLKRAARKSLSFMNDLRKTIGVQRNVEKKKDPSRTNLKRDFSS